MTGTVFVVAYVALLVFVWVSPDRDLRCDESRKLELAAEGRDYSCVLRVPDHPRLGH